MKLFFGFKLLKYFLSLFSTFKVLKFQRKKFFFFVFKFCESRLLVGAWYEFCKILDPNFLKIKSYLSQQLHLEKQVPHLFSYSICSMSFSTQVTNHPFSVSSMTHFPERPRWLTKEVRVTQQVAFMWRCSLSPMYCW